MKAEILTIGNEILIGDTVNTNASWLGRFLTEQGFDVVRMLTIQDDLQTIIHSIDRALQNAEMVITTGGLGPTHDDVTKKALQDLFRVKLIRHEPTLEHIQQYFERFGLPFTKSNYAQADVLENCDVLFNRQGTAPGMWFERDGSYLAVLPGVPHEMRYLMSEEVKPKLREMKGTQEIRITKYLKTAGIGESTLSDRELNGLDQYLSDRLQVAFLPSPQGVTVRISSVGDDRESAENNLIGAEQFIREKAKEYIYGEGRDISLSEVLGQMLRERNMTIATAESCTGGLIANTLTDISGSSDYVNGGIVAYANEVKILQLEVDKIDLQQYGAVSKPVALQMAKGVAEKLNSSIGISTTGIAGPTGGTPEKPIGTVWIGFWSQERHFAVRANLTKNRIINKERSVIIAMDIVRRCLLDIEIMPYGLQPENA